MRLWRGLKVRGHQEESDGLVEAGVADDHDNASDHH
jgi:hypothetical protein